MWAGLAPHQATHKDLATPYSQGWGCCCGMILVTQCASTWEKECTCILRGFFEGAHVGREFLLQKLTWAVSISTSAGTNKTWCLMQTKYKVLTDVVVPRAVMPVVCESVSLSSLPPIPTSWTLYLDYTDHTYTTCLSPPTHRVQVPHHMNSG